MPRDLTIADRCRTEGLRVVECAGWQTRGSSDFNPRGSVNHHTAGSSKGACPSLDGVINGFSGSAPGPLANALQSREPDGNDIIYVVAAGRANHAGEGGWHGCSGNSSVYGLEIEHDGVSPLPEHRQQIAARFHAAMARDHYDVGMVCQHKEWAPGRKIDAAENVDGDHFRGDVADALAGKGPIKKRLLTETGMVIIFGPGGAALTAPGYWQDLDGEAYERWSAVDGMVVHGTDQRGWDVMRAAALYGQTADDDKP